MAGNSFGRIFRITTFGESHGPAVGVVVDGVPPGLELTQEVIQRDMDLRRPGSSGISSPRNEPDRVEILSGVFDGRTTGAPVAMLIRNQDARPGDYDELSALFRPGHADWTWQQKFGHRDWRGGGRASGRETAARVAAGALARLLLGSEGIEVMACAVEIGGIEANVPADVEGWLDARQEVLRSPVRSPDPAATRLMENAVRRAAAQGDSVGGIVEVRAFGVPPGLGEPVFDKLDARLGSALLSIGAVKGVEIGNGFELARAKGSESNDPLLPGGAFASNRSGGILGGISNGELLVVRTPFKHTSSISRPQATVDKDGNQVELSVKGRHDPCIVPRLVPVAEAMVCLVLADFLLIQRARARG